MMEKSLVVANKIPPEQTNWANHTPLERQIVDADFIRATLNIGRTKFYEDLKSGVLPQPSFRLGAKTPRWFWSEVLEHLQTREQVRCTARQRAEAA